MVVLSAVFTSGVAGASVLTANHAPVMDNIYDLSAAACETTKICIAVGEGDFSFFNAGWYSGAGPLAHPARVGGPYKLAKYRTPSANLITSSSLVAKLVIHRTTLSLRSQFQKNDQFCN